MPNSNVEIQKQRAEAAERRNIADSVNRARDLEARTSNYQQNPPNKSYVVRTTSIIIGNRGYGYYTGFDYYNRMPYMTVMPRNNHIMPSIVHPNRNPIPQTGTNNNGRNNTYYGPRKY